MKLKKIFFTGLFVALLVMLFCIAASAEVYSGRALDEEFILSNEGETDLSPEVKLELENGKMILASHYKVQYELNTETGVLRIFCGIKNPQHMLPYAKGAWIPWLKDNMRSYIKTVIIEEGITTVGQFSFYECENLETVYLPHSIRRIDGSTFYECPKLANIYYAGNEVDFSENVLYTDYRNFYTLPSGSLRQARTLVRYGESVTVYCKNQDGEIFDVYGVGSFKTGDAFSFSPKTYKGLTFVGKKDLIEGKYMKGDSRVYEFLYECPHEYEFSDGTVPCSHICIYCGCGNPKYVNEHDWDVTSDTPRSFLHDLEIHKECKNCGVLMRYKETAYVWYFAVVIAALLILAVIALIIVIPIRRKKKMKDLTW